VLDLSPEKILVLGILALVVLGPDRLPGAARTLGRFLGHVRAMSSSFQAEVREALHEPGEAVSSAVGEFRSEFHLGTPGEIRRSVRQAVTDTLIPPDTSAASPPSAATGFNGSNAVPSPHGGPGWPGWPSPPDDPALN
jgi:sec-independent protein translocase protein TatB